MAARNEITKQTLQRLAEMRADGPRVLSVYLDLDPERFATAPARASEVRSLVDAATRAIESGERSHEERGQLREDLQRIERYLSNGGFADGAHGYAVFCSAPLELFETLALPEPIENRVTIGETPFIEPLVGMTRTALTPGRWCVTLINRRVVRMLRGSANELTEVTTEADNVHGQHSQGGFSQARYERSVEKEVGDHVRQAAQALLREYQARPFDGLLIAAPEELRNRIADELHPYVRERLVGFFDADVEHSPAEEVRERAAKQMAEHEMARLHELLERLRAEIGRDGRAAAGARDVLRALHERRIEVLLFDSRLELAGARCPACGLMQTESSGECPADGTVLDTRENLLEDAVRAAMEQDAEVLTLDAAEEPDLGPLGGIAALLRF